MAGKGLRDELAATNISGADQPGPPAEALMRERWLEQIRQWEARTARMNAAVHGGQADVSAEVRQSWSKLQSDFQAMLTEAVDKVDEGEGLTEEALKEFESKLRDRWERIEKKTGIEISATT